MTAGSVRRAMHAVHGVMAIVLISTGLLILWPEFRGRTLGGYGREVGEVHVYAGLAFAIAPVLAWLLVRRGLLAGSWERVAAEDLRTTWRKIHIVLTLTVSAVVSVTGLVMWLGADLPVEVWDAADQIHVVCHWIIVASLPIHLLVVRRTLVERVRLMLGGEPPELFQFADDDIAPGTADDSDPEITDR